MRTVTVNASHQYDVVIAPGIMKEAEIGRASCRERVYVLV